MDIPERGADKETISVVLGATPKVILGVLTIPLAYSILFDILCINGF